MALPHLDGLIHNGSRLQHGHKISVGQEDGELVLLRASVRPAGKGSGDCSLVIVPLSNRRLVRLW
jgi:hypothetical protein